MRIILRVFLFNRYYQFSDIHQAISEKWGETRRLKQGGRVWLAVEMRIGRCPCMCDSSPLCLASLFKIILLTLLRLFVYMMLLEKRIRTFTDPSKVILCFSNIRGLVDIFSIASRIA